jgi:hypothetical protein
MVDVLRQGWGRGLTWDEVLNLRDRVNELLQQIRTERGIEPPVFTCRRCGKRGPAAKPKVSVRAMILALGRFGIAFIPEVKEREKAWNRHRKAEGLDHYGTPERDVAEARPSSCAGH